MFIVLHSDDFGREIALLAVPERIDRQHFHIDRHGVHRLEALIERDERLWRPLYRRPERRVVAPHQLFRLVKEAMKLAPLARRSKKSGSQVTRR
jgi:hypothetical protein